MGIQIIRTENGEELVILPRRDYDAMLARLGDEESEDRMTLLLAAEARSGSPLPDAVSTMVLQGLSVPKALRKWRGATQITIAAAANINQGFLSEIEAGTKIGSADTLRDLAKALNVPEAWLT